MKVVDEGIKGSSCRKAAAALWQSQGVVLGQDVGSAPCGEGVAEGDDVSGQQGSREAHGLAVEVEREEEGWTVTLPRKHEGPGQEQNARAEAPLGSVGGVSRLML